MGVPVTGNSLICVRRPGRLCRDSRHCALAGDRAVVENGVKLFAMAALAENVRTVALRKKSIRTGSRPAASLVTLGWSA